MKKPNTIIENEANLENHKIEKKQKIEEIREKRNKKVLDNEDNADNHRHEHKMKTIRETLWTWETIENE